MCDLARRCESATGQQRPSSRMRIAKRLEEAQAAGDAGGSSREFPEPQHRHGQLPPLRQRRGSDSAIPREKDSLLSPAVPAPPRGPKSARRSPKEAAAGGGGVPNTAAESEKPADSKRDPLEGRKLNLMSYVVFLAVFVAASSNGRTPDMFYQNSVVESYLSLGEVSAAVLPISTARPDAKFVSCFRWPTPGTNRARLSQSRSSGQTFGRG